jgi:drug/metabolite transporter (DMT)-like permease
MKQIANAVSPYAFIFFRFGISFLILLPIFLKRILNVRFIELVYSGIIGLILVIYMYFQILGLQSTTASNSAFITSISVLMIPFISFIVFRKKITISNLFGIIFALVGVYYITGGLSKSFVIGDLYTLICSVLVAIHIILVDYFTKVRKQDALTLGVFQSLFTALFGLIFWGLYEFPSFTGGVYSETFWTNILLIAFFCTAFAYTGQVYMQKFVSTTKISIILLLEPIFTTIYSLFIRDSFGRVEIISTIKIIGIIFVIMGTLISETNSLEKKETFLNI